MWWNTHDASATSNVASDVRDARAVEVRELGARAVLRGADLETLLRNVEAGDSRGGQVPREERHRVAHAGAEVEHARLRGQSAERRAARTKSTILYSAKYSGLSPDTLMFAACIARYSVANLSNSASSIVPLRQTSR